LLLGTAQQKGLVHYFKSQFLDRTFRGLYSPNAFDMMLLIPYFVVMVILAGYGIHRYVLVYMYYRNQKNRTTEPPSQFAELPRVTIQLPIFNEQFVVDRLVEAICKIEYPKDKLDIQVLDDSTDDTVTVAKAVVEPAEAQELLTCALNGVSRRIFATARNNNHRSGASVKTVASS